MSFQLRCNCGWCGPVSEVYLGGKINCPDCGEPIPASQESTPYNYPPFPSWDSQRRAAVRHQPPAVPAQTCATRGSSCEAWNALGLSIAGLVLAFGRISWVAAIVLSLFALMTAFRARTQAANEHRRRPFKSTLAICTATLALVVAGTSMLNTGSCWKKARTVSAPANSAMDAPSSMSELPATSPGRHQCFQYTDKCEQTESRR